MSAEEFLYGVLLSLTGELLESKELPANSYLENLHLPPVSIPTRPIMNQLDFSSPPKQLISAAFVFVRRGALGPPLSPLYSRTALTRCWPAAPSFSL